MNRLFARACVRGFTVLPFTVLIFIVLIFAVSILLMPCHVLLADDFEHRFGEATPGEPAFVVGFDSESKAIKLADDGVRFMWKAKDGVMSHRGVKSVFALRGDFEIEFDFLIGELGKPDIGYGNGLQLSLDFADRERSGLLVSHSRKVDGTLQIVVDKTLHEGSEHRVNKYSCPQGANGFRLERKGTKISVTVVGGDGEETIVEEVFSSESDVFPIGVWAFTGGAKCDHDVTFRRLMVMGASLPNSYEVEPQPTALWVWGFLCCLLLLVGVIGWKLVQATQTPT